MQVIRRRRTVKPLLIALPLFFSVIFANVFAQDILKPDAEGYIRNWIMLAPIVLREGENASDALFKDQIKDEASLRPKAGDKIQIRGRELTWQNITASTNYFDFNALLKTGNDHTAGYMVTYIECESDRPDTILAVASNDQGRIYFNGVDIYAFNESRPLMLDADKGRITLKKGLNVMVFKIINELNSWQGAMRLLDKSGAPLRDVKIRLSP